MTLALWRGETTLFDQVFLTDFGKIASDDDVESGSRLLAEYIYLKRGTPYGRSQASVPKPGGGAGAETILRSFRLDRLGFPRAELCRLIAREVCQRMLGRWLHGMPNVVESARPEMSRRLTCAGPGKRRSQARSLQRDGA